MLRSLIRKDLVLNRNLFWAAIPFFVWVAFALRDEGAPMGMLSVVSALMGSIMAATIATREDRFNATALLLSLPVPRSVLVWSRYAMALGAGGCAFAIAAGLAVGLPWSTHSLVEILDARTIMLAMVVIGLAVSLILPVALRFGSLGVIGLFGAVWIGGIVMIMLSAYSGIRRPAGVIFGGVESALLTLQTNLSDGGVFVLVIAAVALAVWASYRTSLWLAFRRDL
jgi:hypothetical protein